MRRLTVKTAIKIAVLALVTGASASHAAGVAVVNMQKALVESVQAKAFLKRSQEKFAPKREELRKLEEEIRKDISAYERDAVTMSTPDRNSAQKAIHRKQEDYEDQGRALEQEVAKAEQEELSRLGPKLQQALAGVAKQGDYELIVDARTVAYAKPGLDVTAKVIESMNALAK